MRIGRNGRHSGIKGHIAVVVEFAEDIAQGRRLVVRANQHLVDLGLHGDAHRVSR